MEKELFAVVVYNSKENTYTMASHNLPKGDADIEISMLRKERLPAFFLKQEDEHPGYDAGTCQACCRLVKNATPKTSAGAAKPKKRLV